jgi:hypothetical protein
VAARRVASTELMVSDGKFVVWLSLTPPSSARPALLGSGSMVLMRVVTVLSCDAPGASVGALDGR